MWDREELFRLQNRGKLKFYGWQHGGHGRRIGAAGSMAHLRRRLGSTRRSDLFNLGETGNVLEVALLEHTPWIVFETTFDKGHEPYLPVPGAVKDG